MSANREFSAAPAGHNLSYIPSGPGCSECKYWKLRGETHGGYGECRWFWPGLMRHDNPVCNGFESRRQN